MYAVLEAQNWAVAAVADALASSSAFSLLATFASAACTALSPLSAAPPHPATRHAAMTATTTRARNGLVKDASLAAARGGRAPSIFVTPSEVPGACRPSWSTDTEPVLCTVVSAGTSPVTLWGRLRRPSLVGPVGLEPTTGGLKARR